MAHDQSVLSILCARGEIPIRDLGDGFFSRGPEGLSSAIDTSWIATGDFLAQDVSENHINLVKRYLPHLKFLVLNYIYKFTVLPIHFVLFKVAKR